MPQSYIENKRIIQPLYQRYRNTYRGPRSSEKENLEIHKILIDLKRLDEKADTLNEDLYAKLRIIVNQLDPEEVDLHWPTNDGAYYLFTDILVHYSSQISEPDYLELDTTPTITGRMSRILQKIKMLEKNKG